MALLKRGLSQAEVARRIGVTEVSVMRWRCALEAHGKNAWRRKRLGRPPTNSSTEWSPARAAKAAPEPRTRVGDSGR